MQYPIDVNFQLIYLLIAIYGLLPSYGSNWFPILKTETLPTLLLCFVDETHLIIVHKL
jgi:hypothetical protein